MSAKIGFTVESSLPLAHSVSLQHGLIHPRNDHLTYFTDILAFMLTILDIFLGQLEILLMGQTLSNNLRFGPWPDFEAFQNQSALYRYCPTCSIELLFHNNADPS